MAVLRVTIRTMRIAIAEGVGWSLYANLIQGAFLTGYALLLDANPLVLGYLGTLPFVGNFIGIFVAPWIERYRDYKRITVIVETGARLCWLIPLANLFIPSTEIKLAVLVGAATLSYLLHAPAALAWWSWMAKVIPPHVRGSFFMTRNTVMGVAGLIAATLASRFADHFLGPMKEAVAKAQGLPLSEVSERLLEVGKAEWVFVTIFVVAVLFSALSLWLLVVQPAPRPQSLRGEEPPSMAAPIADRHFARFLLFTLVFSLANGIVSPFYIPFMLEDLGTSYFQVIIWQWLAVGTMIITTPIFIQRLDRWGNHRTLVRGVAGVVVLPIIFALARPDNYLPLWIDAVFSGIAWPLVNLAVSNLVIGEAPEGKRAAYVAWNSAVGGAAFFIGGLIGGGMVSLSNRLLESLAGGELWFIFSGYQSVMLLATLGRAVALILILPYRERFPARRPEPAYSARLMARVFGLQRLFSIFSRLKTTEE